MASNAIIKRIDALESTLTPANPPMLINVWTRSLAERIEPLLPKGRDIRLVHLAFRDEEAEQKFEMGLRKTNPAEAKRLDALLRGEFA
jgi:hypothetical protein